MILQKRFARISPETAENLLLKTLEEDAELHVETNRTFGTDYARCYVTCYDDVDVSDDGVYEFVYITSRGRKSSVEEFDLDDAIQKLIDVVTKGHGCRLAIWEK